MSTKLHVYVGPFLSCSPQGDCDVYAITNGLLTKFSSEDCHPLHRDLLFPENIQGVNRQLCFDPNSSDLTPVSINAALRDKELREFFAEFRELIDQLKRHYTSVSLEWGVIPYWY